ncbi:TPA: hypothetical protein DIV49_03920, partial [Candidatus Saccharibacteria bacterium]|nr:hypothetical protein [Candidatus Saccharibacteria bacterium]HRJ90660.1 hypothetical protein [Candidatus Saccharibacteria bacterium]
MWSFIDTRLGSGLLALVLSVCFVTSNVATVSAFDETFYSGNNILFYNPDSPNCGAGSGVIAVEDVELVGSENLEKIFNY